MSVRVAAVEARRCAYAIDPPLVIAGRTIDRREYAVARVVSDSGATGSAYLYSEGERADELVVERLAPQLVGRRLEDLGPDSVDVAVAGGDHALRRAGALLDLCLWDLRAQAAGLPLWRLLGGGNRERVPVLMVDGYPRAGETPSDLGRRIAARADEGYRTVKIAYAGSVDDLDACVREARVGAAEPALVVDAVWLWRRADDARETVARMCELDLAWVEDPIPSAEVEEIRKLRDRAACPIGIGDDLTSLGTLAALVGREAIDVVRLDVTQLGSIGRFRAALALAAEAALPVSPHIYPELHQHLAFAHPGITHVELFPADSPFWFTTRFVRSDVFERIADGHLSPPTRPGLGLELDWDAVEAAPA